MHLVSERTEWLPPLIPADPPLQFCNLVFKNGLLTSTTYP